MKILIIFFLTVLLFITCEKQINIDNEPRRVRAAAAVVRERPDETSGFGSLSFVSKVDIAAPHEAVIRRLFFREGDTVRQGQIIIRRPWLRIIWQNPGFWKECSTQKHNFFRLIRLMQN